MVDGHAALGAGEADRVLTDRFLDGAGDVQADGGQQRRRPGQLPLHRRAAERLDVRTVIVALTPTNGEASLPDAVEVVLEAGQRFPGKTITRA